LRTAERLFDPGIRDWPADVRRLGSNGRRRRGRGSGKCQWRFLQGRGDRQAEELNLAESRIRSESAIQGHEALDAAARYSQDYDGVVANYPAYNVTMLHLGSLNVGSAGFANNGAGWMDAKHTKLLTDAVYAKCDDLDDVKDTSSAMSLCAMPHLRSRRFAVLTEAQPRAAFRTHSCGRLQSSIRNTGQA
jgi:hypothetical protein